MVITKVCVGWTTFEEEVGLVVASRVDVDVPVTIEVITANPSEAFVTVEEGIVVLVIAFAMGVELLIVTTGCDVLVGCEVRVLVTVGVNDAVEVEVIVDVVEGVCVMVAVIVAVKV